MRQAREMMLWKYFSSFLINSCFSSSSECSSIWSSSSGREKAQREIWEIFNTCRVSHRLIRQKSERGPSNMWVLSWGRENPFDYFVIRFSIPHSHISPWWKIMAHYSAQFHSYAADIFILATRKGFNSARWGRRYSIQLTHAQIVS